MHGYPRICHCKISKNEKTFIRTYNWFCLFGNAICFQYTEQKDWISENYPKDKRFETIIVASTDGMSGNVLTDSTIQYVIMDRLS